MIINTPSDMNRLVMALVVFAFAAFCQNAKAASDSYCENYANAAVSQAGENTQLNCGFSGARWIASYDAHFNWCRSVTEAMATTEGDARSSDLAMCKRDRATLDDTVSPQPAIGQTGAILAPSANTAGLFDKCAEGSGQCVWLVPSFENTLYQYNSRERNSFSKRRTTKTWVRIFFPGEKDKIKYRCVFLAANDRVHYNYSAVPIKNEGEYPLIVGSRGDCSKAVSDESWQLIIISKDPMFVSADIRETDDKVRNYGGGERIHLPEEFGNKDVRFEHGQSVRNVPVYPIDCSKPAGYEGVCNLAILHLKDM